MKVATRNGLRTKYGTLVKGKGRGKGKALPVQACKGPEGCRRLRFPDLKTVGTRIL